MRNRLIYDYEELNKYIRYEPDLGLLYWKILRKYPNKVKGNLAGYVSSTGYLHIEFKGHIYMGHVIGWVLTYKNRTANLIDHINGNKSDNRLCNLREVTVRENGQNRVEHRNGKLVGTQYRKRSNTWESWIEIAKKRFYLGNYKTELEAHKAYMKACEKINK